MTTATRQPLRSLPGVITRADWHPPMTCIYGGPGVGKSTFAAGADRPIFIPTEPGVDNLDIARFPVAETLGDFLDHLRAVADGDHDYKTVVIDTLNRLMDLYYFALKDEKSAKGGPLYDFVNFGGYNGWSGVARLFKEEVIPLLAKCKARDMYVVLLAHTGEYTRNNPLGDNLLVAAPSIPKWVWKELHGELDVIGRADYVYSTSRINAGDKADIAKAKAKASTDERIVDGVRVKVRQLTFAGGVEQDCKTRIGYELPSTMPLSWEAFASSLGNLSKVADEVRGLWHLLPADKEAATLDWLEVRDLDSLASAKRSHLSQLRNRLEEMAARERAEAAAETVNEEPTSVG